MTIPASQVIELRQAFLSTWAGMERRLHPCVHAHLRTDLLSTLVALAVAAGDVRSGDVLYAEAETEIDNLRTESSNVVPFPTERSKMVTLPQENDYQMILHVKYRATTAGLNPLDQAEIDEAFFHEDADSLLDVIRAAHTEGDISIHVLPRDDTEIVVIGQDGPLLNLRDRHDIPDWE